MDAHTIRELAKLRERRDAALELAYRPGTGALRRASALAEAHALALGEAAVIRHLAEDAREAGAEKSAGLAEVFGDGMVYVRGRGRVRQDRVRRDGTVAPVTALDRQRAIAHRIAVEESGEPDPDTELEDQTDDRP